MFLMLGAQPNTAWLDGCVALDQRGFVRTGPTWRQRIWNVGQPGGPPFLLETSVPGIFAVGDARAGSVKRIAAAVGEGSTVVQFVHHALATLAESGDRCGALRRRYHVQSSSARYNLQ